MSITGYNTFADLAAEFRVLQRDLKRCKENVFFSKEMPSPNELASLAKETVCQTCRTAPMRLVCHDVHGTAAVLLLRCGSCSEDQYIFVTAEQTTSPDVCIFKMSAKLDSTKSLFADFRCSTCHALFALPEIDESSYEFKPVLPMTMPCSNCRVRMNVVFRDTPLNYYEYALAMGDKLQPTSPGAAVVFFVAALENFLQKSFIFASDFNFFLVRERKVGFQDPREASRVIKSYFGIDLVKLAGSTWETILEAARWRNFVVHNAGHDFRFNPISIDDSHASAMREATTALVQTLDPLMRECLAY